MRRSRAESIDHAFSCRLMPPRHLQDLCKDYCKPMDPLFDFSGKIALVTGRSRGLGYQMVKAFAERGADVIIAPRKLKNFEKVAEECRALGRRAKAFAAHVGKWHQCEKLVEGAYKAFGRADILVNNAGMGPAMPSREVKKACLIRSLISISRGLFGWPARLRST